MWPPFTVANWLRFLSPPLKMRASTIANRAQELIRAVLLHQTAMRPIMRVERATAVASTPLTAALRE
jgi:hypothetical protein